MTQEQENFEEVKDFIEEEVISDEDLNDLSETSEGTELLDEVNELDALTQVNQELEDRVLRLQAEIANMQRINLKERQDSAKYRSQKLATELIDVIDNLERALQTEVTSDDALALKKGIDMVLNSLKNAFERENITAIDPQGQVFDPNFHQAVSLMPGGEGVESDTVINVLQKGYKLHERVLRPAMVIVSE